LPQEAKEFVELGIASRKEMAQIQNDFLVIVTQRTDGIWHQNEIRTQRKRDLK